MKLFVHDNQVYGLTKGQASPTTLEGTVTKNAPFGVFSEQLNPMALAVALDCSFVARSFAGDQGHLKSMIKEAMSHKGFSLVDILQPCVSFNKVNTFSWYKARCKELPPDYDPTNWEAAMKRAVEWGETIPVGILYQNVRPAFESHVRALKEGPLVGRGVDRELLAKILESYS